MQHIIITGNLTADCEIVKKEDVEQMRFTVAVGGGKGEDEKPTFYTCRMRKTGASEYLKKGRGVTLMGTLKVSTNVKDDKTYVNLDVWVTSLELAAMPKD